MNDVYKIHYENDCFWFCSGFSLYITYEGKKAQKKRVQEKIAHMTMTFPNNIFMRHLNEQNSLMQ